MINKIKIVNFKGIECAEFELGDKPVVLIGPNNCGKTSILQALTMWHTGAAEWCERAVRKEKGKFRGVGITRDNFPTLVSPNALLLWRGRNVKSKSKENVGITVQVEGTTDGKQWCIGTKFTYQSKDVVSCRPIDGMGNEKSLTVEVADSWKKHLPRVAFLQPMSGILEKENKLLPQTIDNYIGIGKTAEVLRNLCYQVLNPEIPPNDKFVKMNLWRRLQKIIKDKFIIEIDAPILNDNGYIVLEYRQEGKRYDISSGGRGFHQTLLILAYLYSHPGSIILMDEPDAHLEIIRQRDMFTLLCDETRDLGSQLIIASHSEIIMNEGGDKGGIVSVIDGCAEGVENTQQLRKLLTSIEWNIFCLAKAKKHILFLEGTSDINMLAAYAEKLYGGEKAEKIRLANVEILGTNKPEKARDIFYGLQNAVSDLQGYALFDNVPKSKLHSKREGLAIECWERREIENYLLIPEVLNRFVKAELEKTSAESPLLKEDDRQVEVAMENAILNNTTPRALKDPKDKSWRDKPMSEYLGNVLDDFYQNKDVKNRQDIARLAKKDYYHLVKHLSVNEIPEEVKAKLDKIIKTVSSGD